jgi:hypothetical protein
MGVGYCRISGLIICADRMLDLLQADANTDSIAKAVAKWDALELENAIDEARVCGGMIRTNEEWLQEPHGKILATKPVVEIIKIGDSEPEPMPAGDRPLSGIKALDLTRILAGTDHWPHPCRTWGRCSYGLGTAFAAGLVLCCRYKPWQAKLLSGFA